MMIAKLGKLVTPSALEAVRTLDVIQTMTVTCLATLSSALLTKEALKKVTAPSATA
jgi:hypothetical protein